MAVGAASPALLDLCVVDLEKVVQPLEEFCARAHGVCRVQRRERRVLVVAEAKMDWEQIVRKVAFVWA